MVSSIKNSFNLISNMGWRYTQFRVKHEFLKLTGTLKKKYPVAPSFKQYINLQQWKDLNNNFFFNDNASLQIVKQPSPKLQEWFANYQNGELIFFNSTTLNIGKDFNWVTNPDTGYTYDVTRHWTEIADISKEAGDIKYVWEKSRFSFLYNIIRYDYHFERDCSKIVFKEILSWIEHNPINCGPNYRCSQEISLRVLNWTFALFYYKNSPSLTKEVFDQIQFAIYWQMDHVYKNIDFSRIAVRNNHAITETLALYLVGLLYPGYPDAAKWKQNGKAWFEEEIAYQVYEDGTYLQFSMNYHRVVIQLLTWALVLAEKNNEKYKSVVYESARKSLEFLRVCMNNENGWLPNYGANDGALFFPLNDNHYRDYRPQLQALAGILNESPEFETETEDLHWYGIVTSKVSVAKPLEGIFEFKDGGYYIIREADTLTFIRCGNHKDRPSQADNLHLDIWVKGENILRDGGSYKYNAEEDIMRFFFGTASHNTIMLGHNDQMQKGKRFIWYHWTQSINAKVTEMEDYYEFHGAIKAFQHVQPGTVHKRTVRKYKGKWKWEVQDEMTHATKFTLNQIWNPAPDAPYQINITAFNKNGLPISAEAREGWYSSEYGKKELCNQLVYSTTEEQIRTTMEVNRK